jgi:hypothetical protein
MLEDVHKKQAARFDLNSIKNDMKLIKIIQDGLAPGGYVQIVACGYSTGMGQRPWEAELQALADLLGVPVVLNTSGITLDWEPVGILVWNRAGNGPWIIKYPRR